MTRDGWVGGEEGRDVIRRLMDGPWTSAPLSWQEARAAALIYSPQGEEGQEGQFYRNREADLLTLMVWTASRQPGWTLRALIAQPWTDVAPVLQAAAVEAPPVAADVVRFGFTAPVQTVLGHRLSHLSVPGA